MWGALAGADSASSRRTDRLPRRAAANGTADRGGRDGLLVAPVLRGGAIMRRGYTLLIATAVAIVSFHELAFRFGRANEPHSHGSSLKADDVVWALPALALGALVGAMLVV